MKFSGSGLTTSAIYGAPVSGVAAELTADAVVRAFLRRASQPPTVEQYGLHVRCAIESWPEAVRALSFKSSGFQITGAQREWLAEIAGELLDMNEADANKRFSEIAAHRTFAELGARCDEEIGTFDSPPYFKLGTRSPKDSPMYAQFGGRVPTGGAVICNIASSWRAFEDFAISQTHSMANGATRASGLLKGMFGKTNPEAVDHLPWFWFREYQTWKPWQEFRCFMRDGQFVGATQYYGVDPKVDGPVAFPDLVERGYAYEQAIKDWFPQFASACEGYLKGCVFDVVVDLDAPRVTLIEINPAAVTTFPGLMDWKNPASFDGELKWLDAQYLPGAVRVDADEIHNFLKKGS